MPGDAKATITTPAAKTITAPPAAKTAPGRPRKRGLRGFAAVAPPAASAG